ncbi:putative superinfection exclusion protein 17 [Pectobacterium phage vB_PcaM_P7_Pc]|nr:putative superinfection exclusion protein 17 [Pectobacterium phage vB_PcaM_P7_Pc]
MALFRVCHFPQAPMEPFVVPASTLEEAVTIMDILADYDLFQFENKIKPDYCNMTTLQFWDDGLTDQDLADQGLTDRWVDWYDDEHYFDDPRDLVNHLKTTGGKAYACAS